MIRICLRTNHGRFSLQVFSIKNFIHFVSLTKHSHLWYQTHKTQYILLFCCFLSLRTCPGQRSHQKVISSILISWVTSVLYSLPSSGILMESMKMELPNCQSKFPTKEVYHIKMLPIIITLLVTHLFWFNTYPKILVFVFDNCISHQLSSHYEEINLWTIYWKAIVSRRLRKISKFSKLVLDITQLLPCDLTESSFGSGYVFACTLHCIIVI